MPQAWRPLTGDGRSASSASALGEMEVELRWVFDCAFVQALPEPLFKLHFKALSAQVLRSHSDDVVEGAAHVGVRCSIADCSVDEEEVAQELVCTLELRVVRCSNLKHADEFSGQIDPFAIVKRNGREVKRTHVKHDTLAPEWSELEACVVNLAIVRPVMRLSDSSSSKLGETTEELDVLKGRETRVVIEVWDAKANLEKGDFLGQVELTPEELCDLRVHGVERSFALREKPGTPSVGVRGEVVLRWTLLKRRSSSSSVDAEELCNALTEAVLLEAVVSSKTCAKEDVREWPDAPLSEFAYCVTISQFKAQGLPETKLLGTKQSLYVKCLLADRSHTSSTLKGCGTTLAAWPRGEELRLPARAQWTTQGTTEELLRFEVWTHNSLLPDRLVGTCKSEERVALKEHWCDLNEPQLFTFKLQRPGKPPKGTLDLKVTLERRRASRSRETVLACAREEKRAVVAQLEKSHANAKHEQCVAALSCERAGDPARRCELRAVAHQKQLQTGKALRRLKAVKHLPVETFKERALQKLDAAAAQDHIHRRRGPKRGKPQVLLEDMSQPERDANEAAIVRRYSVGSGIYD